MSENRNLLSRRGAVQTLAAGAAALALKDTLTAPAFAAAPAKTESNPGAHWERWAKPQDAGFKDDLSKVLDALYPLPTTSFMVVRGGKVALSYGFVDQVSYLASSRKSIMSMLYGKYVANGTIKLDATMADLGIDDIVGLTPQEKSATVRHLLMSSSGVYTPQGSPGGDQNTPPRGSQKPGAHFHYNNWDFNVAGFVFEKLTGKTVFKALAEDLAAPLQFEDFDINRLRMMGYEPATSRYKAYHMFLSGRDMARLGLCMLNGGKWNGQQIVPAAWVQESTATHVVEADKQRGYGYLWWLPSHGRKAPEWAGSYMADGNYGQYIVVLPALDLVVVHRRAVTDDFAIARNLGRTSANPPGGGVEILPIVDQVVAALKA
jgi:CubicO group peptidase (beta-lactamase class C family)